MPCCRHWLFKTVWRFSDAIPEASGVMFDFTSALYLGLKHPSGSAPPWNALTLGRPAALQEPPDAVEIAAELAALQGCEAATLLPSTLHLFWDLFGVLARDNVTIYVEAPTYAIARWGVEHGASLGIGVFTFPCGDVAVLERLIGGTPGYLRRPLIVCDAVRPGSDRQPPLAQYAAVAARHGGCLVLDDTQALGIFGRGVGPAAPLGSGGGGSLRRHALSGAHIIVGASLAKAFGVPVAVLSGSRAVVRRFEKDSQTRVHASPPSQAVIHAARHALALNRRFGDGLRLRLWRRVQQFRQQIAQHRLHTMGGDFPVQSLVPVKGVDTEELHACLLERRVRTVLHLDGRAAGARLSFIFTAAQSAGCIDRAVTALAQTVRALRCRGAPTTPYLEAT
jgi:8-amino-7-oxononanoate synthase